MPWRAKGPMCVLPASCCLLGTHYWEVYCIVSQPRWQLEGQGQLFS
ncbi:rCG36145 [Rattus norvegicus]|uniref:RCG36145 n=1 Tax=Rattus norvegicus TaxID=10116 RepID=A6IKC4_RAT|nr:rCG36145 [Rattus norvegicus]